MRKVQITYTDLRGRTRIAWRWPNQVDAFCRRAAGRGMADLATRTHTEANRRGPFRPWRPPSS